jgi:hypothetical protein
MKILVEDPANLPDAIQCAPQQFMQEVKMAMGGKLHDVIGLDKNELAEDIANA